MKNYIITTIFLFVILHSSAGRNINGNPMFSFEPFNSMENISPNIKKTKKEKRVLKWKKKAMSILNKKKTQKGILFGALGATLVFSFFRRRMRKLKRKIPTGISESSGCLTALLIIVGVGLLSAFGGWLMTSVFGVSVGFWAAALIGFAVFGAIGALIYFLTKD